MAQRGRTAGPYSPQPRRGRYDSDTWDVQRTVILLTTQLQNERDILTTFQRRLQLRVGWEKVHVGASQLPALRQACAACNCRVIELEKRLIDARHLLRILRARQDAR